MDIQSYTQRARAAIQAAQTEAVTRDHQQLMPAHILHGLLHEEGGLPRNLIQMAGASPDEITKEVETVLAGLPQVQGGSGLSLSKPCLLYTSPSPRDGLLSRMPSSA